MRAAKAQMLIARRNAFSLIELTVVLAIAGILGGSVGLLLMRQQRFYRGSSELIIARQSVRDALEVLSTDLRGMSVTDTARLLADSALEIFSTTGGSVVCQVSGASEVGLPPATSGATLTSFATQPDTGDLAVFYVDSGPPETRWRRYRITAFSSRALSTTCPPASGFSQNADIETGSKAFAISLNESLSIDIHPGSPVRFVRRGRYSLYRASDGAWYLGYRRCNAIGASSCGSVQPLSGPYRPYSRDVHQSGLVFEYFDRSGDRLVASPLSLSRVDVTARAASPQSLLMDGHPWLPSDSARISVAVRNRLQ
ncbi:MAG TPA: type II secretion system protein [Gemmatimonadaceae bacterium]|nr:type II secretion system protein [Gemmatimonadaceae bacterium]